MYDARNIRNCQVEGLISSDWCVGEACIVYAKESCAYATTGGDGSSPSIIFAVNYVNRDICIACA